MALFADRACGFSNGDFIEDRIGQLQLRAIRADGLAAHAWHGQHVLDDGDERIMVAHLDGRDLRGLAKLLRWDDAAGATGATGAAAAADDDVPATPATDAAGVAAVWRRELPPPRPPRWPTARPTASSCAAATAAPVTTTTTTTTTRPVTARWCWSCSCIARREAARAWRSTAWRGTRSEWVRGCSRRGS